jgi:hypothetical protein
MATRKRRRAPPRGVSTVAPAVTAWRESRLRQFVELSAALTGFTEAEIHGTGMVEAHFRVIPTIVGDGFFGRLLTRWQSIRARAGDDEAFRDELILSELLADDPLGPLARNLAALWYLGIWFQLPAAWRQEHGAFARDATHVLSSRAYTEALVWRAAQTHPPAAKAPGFGSWAMKPEGVP